LSLVQAAKVAGFSKRTFIEITEKYGFSIFQISEAKLLNDIANV
jgi:hypothetical protein